MGLKLIATMREEGYIEAYPYDCIYLTHPRDRHTPVKHRMAGTVTSRAGELGVLIPKGNGE